MNHVEMMSMYTKQESSKIPIPKKIHFIWIGGPIPEKYLKSILGLAQVAKLSGYELNVWVDNEDNYRKPLNHMHKNLHGSDLAVSNDSLDKVLGIKVRTIEGLKSRMYGDNADSYYKGSDPDFPLQKGEDRAKDFWDCVDRERVGFKNLAAASDFLRIEILRQEGGFYLDADTEFPQINRPTQPNKMEPLPTDPPGTRREIERQNKLAIKQYQKDLKAYEERVAAKKPPPSLQQESSCLGIRGNFELQPYLTDGEHLRIVNVVGCNDVMGTTANHEVTRDAIRIAINSYKEMDKDKTTVVNTMQVKRFPEPVKTTHADATSESPPPDRKSLTVSTSGAAMFTALRNFWRKHNSIETLDTMLSDKKVLGIEFRSKFDNTWLAHGKQKLSSFYKETIERIFPSNSKSERESKGEGTSRRLTD
ncbi:TcdA/TcdB catalytic glycosyltransferase domain-containing protein [Legionella waltersii]|uniref:Glycosyltransferase n=1 Tax=Legionella waltersii TaxID=66969 RepID=A0A0W1A5I7_9GAMM|nr:TcdA/TcdB catalytic glycosyltransferase domain-containing protein [Legionella waltersii]KTD76582.1 glycosyltransferase [Legionella waltersii]SNU94458.1 glycosyltransferase [Legionella waltersii]